MLGTKRKFEESDNGSDNDNSKKQKTDDLDNIQKHKEIQSKNDEIKKENFYESAYLNEYYQIYQQTEKEIQILQLKQDNFLSTLTSFIDSLSVMEKYYYLQENEIALKLYFDNTITDNEDFFAAVSLYKYLEENNVKNPILLSWMDSIDISINHESLGYHEETYTDLSMGPFSIFFTYNGDNEGEGTYTVAICGGKTSEVYSYSDIDYEDEDIREPLQKLYDEHCDSKELSFSELVDFCSYVSHKEKWQYNRVSWDTYSRNKNLQKSARK